MRLLELVAQTTTTATSQPAQAPPSFFDVLRSPMTGLMLAFVLLYIYMMRNKRGDEKKRTNMLKALKKNDRVQTIGGIIGSVVEVRDGDVVVKVDETTNTKMRFVRSAIHRVITDDKVEAK